MGGINYPKEFVKPDGRKLVSGGPRDLQRRQRNQPSERFDLEGLKKELDSLKKELRKTQPQQTPKDFFSPEQVDEEVRKAVEQAVAETLLSVNKNNGSEKTNELEKEIAVLKQDLIGKEELIETFKSKVDVSGGGVVSTNRPKMEQQFIDPLEKDAGKGLKSRIDTINVSTTETENMSEKVDKLKDLLGKLPIGNN